MYNSCSDHPKPCPEMWSDPVIRNRRTHNFATNGRQENALAANVHVIHGDLHRCTVSQSFKGAESSTTAAFSIDVYPPTIHHPRSFMRLFHISWKFSELLKLFLCSGRCKVEASHKVSSRSSHICWTWTSTRGCFGSTNLHQSTLHLDVIISRHSAVSLFWLFLTKKRVLEASNFVDFRQRLKIKECLLTTQNMRVICGHSSPMTLVSC